MSFNFGTMQPTTTHELTTRSGKRLKLHPDDLVCLRYFGPEVNPDAAAMGAF